MAKGIGRDLFGSLRARVKDEIKELAATNRTFRRARRGVLSRVLFGLLSNLPLARPLLLYAAIAVSLVASEWWVTVHYPCMLPALGSDLPGFLKDVTGYLVAGQVGLLAIMSVALAVVTLLSGSKTDIRLYYSESMAYELLTSGIALLVVLTVQLFWPLQTVLHQLGLIDDRGFSQLVLTLVHAAWTIVNVLIFYQFVLTTLRFVEPDARKAMRDRYTVNTALPHDIRERLLRVFYLQTPGSLIGEASHKWRLPLSRWGTRRPRLGQAYPDPMLPAGPSIPHLGNTQGL